MGAAVSARDCRSVAIDVPHGSARSIAAQRVLGAHDGLRIGLTNTILKRGGVRGPNLRGDPLQQRFELAIVAGELEDRDRCDA